MNERRGTRKCENKKLEKKENKIKRERRGEKENGGNATRRKNE